MMWFPSWTFLVHLAINFTLCRWRWVHVLLPLRVRPDWPLWRLPMAVSCNCVPVKKNEHLEFPKVPCLAQYVFHYSVGNTLKSSKADWTWVYKYLKGCKTSQERPEQLETPLQFPQFRVRFVSSYSSPRWLMNMHTVLQGNRATFERWW